jgi:RNA polymerase sigma factor (sigma-70 family)
MADSPRAKTKDWKLTQEGFDLLLARLDADRNIAGEKYEAARQKLIKFLGWWGSQSPEDLADESIDRLIKKIAAGEDIKDLTGYLIGVARLVFKEHVKDQVKRRNRMEQVREDRPLTDDQIDSEARHQCYERCLEGLSSDNRELVVNYYQEEKRKKAAQREELSARLGIPINLLRIRAFRIRKKLGECLQKCLSQRS